MIQVGSRVCDRDGYTATVRYIGPVATSKKPGTVYAGVEWDAADRGKNDGSVQTSDGSQIRYFSCAFGHGSFVKLSLLLEGVEFVHAVKQRYEDDASIEAGSLETPDGRDIAVILVGAEQTKAKQHARRLQSVCLKGCKIAKVSDNSVSEVCPQLTEVDLSDNLLSDWQTVLNLNSQLNSLQILNLSGNRLPSCTPDNLPRRFECKFLVVLVLNRCKLQWSDAVCFAQLTPTLEELHLCENEIESLELTSLSSSSESVFASLQHLNLSGNQLSSWSEVLRLGSLPRLSTLNVSSNPLTCVDFEAGFAVAGAQFTQLTALNLTGNAIDTWSSIDQLRKLPQLKSLRISNNPLNHSISSPSVFRQLVIARMPLLHSLNGSVIRDKERDDAEKFYVRMVADGIGTWQEVFETLGPVDAEDITENQSNARKALALDHPLWLRHAHNHHLFTNEEQQAAQRTVHQTKTIEVTLRSMAASSCDSDPVMKRVLPSMTVGQVKLLVHKLFNIEVSSQRLFFRDTLDSFPQPLEDDSQTLSYFAIVSGAEILVQEAELDNNVELCTASQTRASSIARQMHVHDALQAASVQASNANMQRL